MPTAFLAVAVAAALLGGCAARNTAASAPDAPPIETALAAPTRVADLFRRTCNDCHSSRAHPGWATKLAFSYWFPSYRLEAVNFAAWPAWAADRRDKTRSAIADVIRAGRMPPLDYRLLHPSLRLTQADTEAILTWAGGTAE